MLTDKIHDFRINDITETKKKKILYQAGFLDWLEDLNTRKFIYIFPFIIIIEKKLLN